MSKLLPPNTIPEEQGNGWEIDLVFLETIQAIVEQSEQQSISLSIIQSTLLAAEATMLYRLRRGEGVNK